MSVVHPHLEAASGLPGFPIQLNLNVRGMAQSITLAINERSAALQAQGGDIYRLGLGQSPYPVPASVVAALKRHAGEKDYLPVRGLQALRDAVADYHHRVDGVARTGDDVLIGPGSKELMFILQMVHYGDLVIPAPSWVSYMPQAHIVGRQIRWLRTRRANDWKLQAEELEALCDEDPGRPRILILNYPGNPTGVTYTELELAALARVARRHGIVLLSDEIYAELHFQGRHQSIANYYPEGTIISSGLSKWCGAGGWRLGTFLFPPELRWLLDSMAVVASETFTTTSAPIQYAAITAYQQGPDILAYLERERAVQGALTRRVSAELRAAGLDLADADGAFYLFVDFERHRERLLARGIQRSEQLTDRLLDEAGVAILPGSAFGRSRKELTARLALVNFDGAEALRALALGAEADDDFVEVYCDRVVAAARRIGDWLSDGAR